MRGQNLIPPEYKYPNADRYEMIEGRMERMVGMRIRKRTK
jgi:hypothetical protein